MGLLSCYLMLIDYNLLSRAFWVQIYWSQVFALPQKVLKLIQTACRVFLWTIKCGISKRALIAWEHICLPKLAGGWNVINLKC
jgi:hypothetical protein